MKQQIVAIVGFLAVFGLSSQNARAIENFGFNDLSTLTNGATEDLLKTFAYGGDYHAYLPASPVGGLLGLEIGVEATLIQIPDSFNDALALVGSSSLPESVPLPRVMIHKSLFGKLDLGFSYIGVSGDSLWSASAKWTIINPANFAVAGRVSYTDASISFLSTSTFTVDVLASMNFFVLEPYLGFGYQFGSGELDLSFNAAAGAPPANVSTSASFSAPHFFVGLPIKLLFLKLTAEYQKTLGENATYGAKISFTI